MLSTIMSVFKIVFWLADGISSEGLIIWKGRAGGSNYRVFFIAITGAKKCLHNYFSLIDEDHF